jgi:hypothetical protein
LPGVVRKIISSRMKWAGRVDYMGKMRNVHIWAGKYESHVKNLVVDAVIFFSD